MEKHFFIPAQGTSFTFPPHLKTLVSKEQISQDIQKVNMINNSYQFFKVTKETAQELETAVDQAKMETLSQLLLYQNS